MKDVEIIINACLQRATWDEASANIYTVLDSSFSVISISLKGRIKGSVPQLLYGKAYNNL